MATYLNATTEQATYTESAVYPTDVFYDRSDTFENSTLDRSETNETTTTSALPLNTFLTDTDYEHYAFIIYSFVIPSICLCGIMGNVMAVAVLYRTARQLKQSIYIYMCALTMVDTIYMLCSFIRSIPAIIKNFDKLLFNYLYCHTIAALVFFDISLHALSATILILMSTERVIAIRHPLSVKSTLIAKKPFVFIGCACVIVFVITLPLPFLMKVTESRSDQNVTVYETIVDPKTADIFETYVATETILLSYMPFVAILGLNIAIPVAYHKTRKQRERIMTSVNASINSNLRIVATVFIVMLMYTLLALPQMFIQTLSIIDKRFSVQGSEENMFWFLSDVSNVLVNLSMAIDFIIYVLMSKVYRERFLDMFCRKPDPLYSFNAYSFTDLSFK